MILRTSIELPKIKLSDLTHSIKRGISSYYLQKEGAMTPFINIKDVCNGKINTDTVENVIIKETEAVDKSRIEPGDIIITIKGSTFKTAVADDSVKDFVISANLIALKLNEQIQPEILSAYLNSPTGQKKLQSRSAGAVQKSLNLKSLMSVTVPVLPNNKQQILAEYLMLSKKHTELSQKENELRNKINDVIIQNFMTG